MPTLLLALPYLHAELAPSSAHCRTIWPGLPKKPAHAWEPHLPFSPAMAAACLADYERACLDGASGTPVLTLGAETAPPDLSAAERRALNEMAGLPQEKEEAPLRHTAQQMLLLIWLMEKQALEMASLESKIGDARITLAGIFSGHAKTKAKQPALPSETELPHWSKALFAALAFVQDMPEPTAFAITCPSMAKALAHEKDAGEGSSDMPVHVKVSELAALSGRSECARLKRELPKEQWNRSFALFLPEHR